MVDKEKKRLRDKIYRLNHLEQIRRKDRLYQASHLENHRKISKRYYERHRELCIQRNREWQIKNPEKLKEASKRYNKNHPERVKERDKKSRKNHPERNAKYCTLRRARVGSVICTLTREDIFEMKSRGCLACNSMDNLTIAHNIPVSKGGNTTRDNCFCLCKSCNSKMQTKTLEEWNPDLFKKYKSIYL